MSRRSAVILFLLGFQAACGPGEGRESVVSVRDSAGVRIVEYRSFPEDLPLLQWDSSRIVHFDGNATGLGIFWVSGAFRGPGGSVVVGDGGNHRILRFRADGTLLSSTGRQGEGPGEFGHLSLLTPWRSDSLLAWDSSLRRLSVFSSTGEFARSFSLERNDSIGIVFVQAAFVDGPILATGFMDTGGAVTSGLHRYPSPMYFFNPDGSLRVGLGMVPGAEQYYEATGSRFRSEPPPFGRTTEKVLSGDHLVLASNDSYEVVFLSWAGDPTQRIRCLAPPTPVTPSIRDQAKEAMLDQVTDPGAREELETMLARMPIAETLPAYGRVFGDRVGRLWLEEYVVGTPTHTEWRVFSQDGLALFSVDLPTRFQPTDAGSGYLIGVLKSELDVEGVILAPLATSPD